MLCPICKSAAFTETLLPDGPVALECTSCRGHFIPFDNYFHFLQNAALDAPPPPPQTAPPADSPALKLCPQCAKFMHYYPVGHDLTFGIDKCHTCGGTWLNALEWQALAAQNLHRKLHFIPSDPWQLEVARQSKIRAEAQALRQRLGPADFNHLQNFLTWLQSHPHKPTLLAHLHQSLHTTPFSQP